MISGSGATETRKWDDEGVRRGKLTQPIGLRTRPDRDKGRVHASSEILVLERRPS